MVDGPADRGRLGRQIEARHAAPGLPGAGRSTLRRRRGDWNLPRFRLIAGSRSTGILGLDPGRGRHTAVLAILVMAPLPSLLALSALDLVLLGSLIHRVQDAEIVFGVLEVAFCRHPVTAAGRVAPELKILLEQLLGGATDPQIGPVAVENVVAVERYVAARVMAHTPTAAAAPTSAATRTMVAATHAFHVHSAAVALSSCR